MVTHQQIWHGIDKVANDHNWSLLELALRAGLDPSALNRSKRFSSVGKPRWPSTETVAKILTAAAITLTEFSQLIS